MPWLKQFVAGLSEALVQSYASVCETGGGDSVQGEAFFFLPPSEYLCFPLSVDMAHPTGSLPLIFAGNF